MKASRTLIVADPAAILSAARPLGFQGFSGWCWIAAIAINRVIFNGQGRLIAGLNASLFGATKKLVGHAAVVMDSQIWDAEARPKGFDDIESWGMLDPADSSYQSVFWSAGLPWTEETANDAAIFEFDDEAELMRLVGITEDDIAPMTTILSAAAQSLASGLADRGIVGVEVNAPAVQIICEDRHERRPAL